MSNFKVGDRVETIKTDGKAVKGLKGTIRGVSPQYDGCNYEVEFDEKMGGHDLHSCVCSCPKCKNGHGWWVAAKNIRLLESRFEVGQIYRVGDVDDRNGNIVRIASTTDVTFCYKTIRGKDSITTAGNDSWFARSLTLLTGPQIGEAIRKWDNEHFKKETGVREEERYAKVGEYVKVISGDGHAVPVGSIVKVTGADDNGWIRVCPEGYVNTLRTGQYVVLKGYKPEQKEERRKAKVGDTIKILPHAVDIQHGYKPGDTVFIDGVKEKPAPDGFIWGCGASYSDDDAKNEYVIISSGKHSYTTEQIDEAKKLCGKMMLEAFDDGNTFNLRILDKNYDKSNSAVNCEISRFNNAHNSSATARCSDHDEYSVWIGRCVALCKALHKPIPAFIMEG